MEEITICRINLDDIANRLMNYVSGQENIDEAIKIQLKEWGDCDIKVKGNEGIIPHFHLEKISNRSQYCCICIYVPMFFKHNDSETILSNKRQKQYLDAFLRSSYNENATYWDLISASWQQINVNNSSVTINIFKQYCLNNRLDINNLIQPDYTKMKDSVHD